MSTSHRPSPAPINRNAEAPADGHEPYYLEAGSSNRMVLSLRSLIPDQVDWSLQSLARLSFQFPAEFHLQPFNGLVDGLLAYPREAVHRAATGDYEGQQPAAFEGGWQDTLRRANESALVLRNMSMQEGNAGFLESAGYRPTIIGILVALLALVDDDEDLAELTLAFLDIAHPVAHNVRLERMRGRDLVAPLGRLVHSNDRALILAGLRLLTALAINERNETAIVNRVKTPLDAVLTLLPLPDAPLRGALLEYLYQTTLFAGACTVFFNHCDFVPSLRLLATFLYEEAEEEERLEPFPIQPRALPEREPLNGVLDAEDLSRLVPLQEPERAVAWMRTLFAFEAESEVTQVAFWTMYKDTFTPYSTPMNPLLAAAEVIKNVQTAFPQAVAQVTQDKPARFVIKNLRLRDKDEKYRFRCRWGDDTRTFDNPQDLYDYVCSTYIDAEPAPPALLWAGTTFTPSPDSSLSLREQMKRRLLTYLPTPSRPARAPGQPAQLTVPPNALTPILPDATAREIVPPPTKGVSHSVLHAQQDEQGFPTGLGYVAALVLRNLARAVSGTAHASEGPGGEGMFGLPIPPSLLASEDTDEEEEAEREAERERREREKEVEGEGEDVRRGRQKAKKAFRSVRDVLTDVATRGVGKLPGMAFEVLELTGTGAWGV